MAEFTIQGGKQIEAVLKEMPVKLQRKALRNAVRQGANIVKKQAQNNAKSHGLDPDYIKDITVSVPKGRAKLNKETVLVLAVKKEHSALAHLFEFGTAERTRKNGGAMGRIRPMPHLRPALDTKGQAAIEEIATVLRKNIELIARDLNRGSKISLTKTARRGIA